MYEIFVFRFEVIDYISTAKDIRRKTLKRSKSRTTRKPKRYSIKTRRSRDNLIKALRQPPESLYYKRPYIFGKYP